MAIKMKKTPRFKKIWLSFLSVFLLAALFLTPQVIAAGKTAREKAIEFANEGKLKESFAINVTFGGKGEDILLHQYEENTDNFTSSSVNEYTETFPLFENADSRLYYQLVFNNKSSGVYRMILPEKPQSYTTYHVGFAYMNCDNFGQLRAVKLFGLNLSSPIEIRNVDVSRVVEGARNLENWQFYGGNTENKEAVGSVVINNNSHDAMTKFQKGGMSAFLVSLHTHNSLTGGTAYNSQISCRINYSVQDNEYERVEGYLKCDATHNARLISGEKNYDPFTRQNATEKMVIYCRNIKSFKNIYFVSNSYNSWYPDCVDFDLAELCFNPQRYQDNAPMGMKRSSRPYFSYTMFPKGYGQVDNTQRPPNKYEIIPKVAGNSITEAPGVADFSKYDVEPQKPGPNKLMDIYVFPAKDTKIEGDIKLKINLVQTIGNYPVEKVITLTKANAVDVNGTQALRFVDIKMEDFGHLNSTQISSVANESFPVIDYVMFNLRNEEPNSLVDKTAYADFNGAEISQVSEAMIEEEAPERLKQTQRVSICTEDTLNLKDGEDVFVSLQYNDIFGNRRIGEYQSLSKLGVKSFIQGQTTTVDIKTQDIYKVTGINLYHTIPKAPIKPEDATEVTRLDMVYVESFNSKEELTSRAASFRTTEINSSIPTENVYFITTDKKSDNEPYLLSDTNVAYKAKIDFKTGSDLESSTMSPFICTIYLENGKYVAYQLDNESLLGVSKAFVEGTTSSLNVILDSKITSISLSSKLGSGDDLWKLESVSFAQEQLGTKTPAEVVSRTINSWIGDQLATIPLVGDIDIPKVKEEEIPVLPPDQNPPAPNQPNPNPTDPNPPAPNQPNPNPTDPNPPAPNQPNPNPTDPNPPAPTPPAPNPPAP